MAHAPSQPAAHPPDAPRALRRAAARALVRLLWPLLGLALLATFNILFTPHFAEITVLNGRLHGPPIDILYRSAPVLLTAFGMTLVIATGGVDLSVGAVIAIAGAVAALLLTRTTLGVPVVVTLALVAALLCGVWNGLLVAGFGVQPIVATLVLMVAGRGVAQLITGGYIITFERPTFEFIAGGAWLGLPFTVTLVAITFLMAVLATRGAALGLFLESVGDNETAARYAGVPVRMVKLLAYAFSGLTAGLAGLIVCADIKAADVNNAGLYYELDAILAVVMGGTALTGGRFSLVGAILGALLIQTLTTTILMRGIDVEYTLVVKALVVFAVCLLQADEFRRRLARLGRRRPT